MKGGSRIPPESRTIVGTRDGGMCVRCFGFRNLEWHHRRTRSVIDIHRHCACVGVMLCHTCHGYLHRNPEYAMAHGLIVSRFEAKPFTVPYQQGLNGLWVMNACDGSQAWLPKAAVGLVDGIPVVLDSQRNV